jgi:hypothetical protein
MLNQESAATFASEGTVFCIDGGSEFLDALFLFTAILLVFMIGLGLGLFIKGP